MKVWVEFGARVCVKWHLQRTDWYESKSPIISRCNQKPERIWKKFFWKSWEAFKLSCFQLWWYCWKAEVLYQKWFRQYPNVCLCSKQRHRGKDDLTLFDQIGFSVLWQMQFPEAEINFKVYISSTGQTASAVSKCRYFYRCYTSHQIKSPEWSDQKQGRPKYQICIINQLDNHCSISMQIFYKDVIRTTVYQIKSQKWSDQIQTQWSNTKSN